MVRIIAERENMNDIKTLKIKFIKLEKTLVMSVLKCKGFVTSNKYFLKDTVNFNDGDALMTSSLKNKDDIRVNIPFTTGEPEQRLTVLHHFKNDTMRDNAYDLIIGNINHKISKLFNNPSTINDTVYLTKNLDEIFKGTLEYIDVVDPDLTLYKVRLDSNPDVVLNVDRVFTKTVDATPTIKTDLERFGITEFTWSNDVLEHNRSEPVYYNTEFTWQKEEEDSPDSFCEICGDTLWVFWDMEDDTYYGVINEDKQITKNYKTSKEAIKASELWYISNKTKD